MGELETEEPFTRFEIATYLRRLADRLVEGGAVTRTLGDQQVSLVPVEPITFGLEGESGWSEGDVNAKQRIEFVLVWRTSATTAEEGTFDIELIS